MKKFSLKQHISLFSLKYIGLTLVLLLGLITCLYTQMGCRFVLFSINHLSHTHVTLESFEGSLAGGFSAQGVSLEHPDFTLSIKSLHADWQARDLLTGNLTFSQIKIDGFDFHAQKISQAGDGVGDFDFSIAELRQRYLPKRLNIVEFYGSDMTVHTQTPLVFETLNFKKLQSQSSFSLESFYIKGPFGYLMLEGQAQFKATFDLNVNDLSLWLNDAQGDLKAKGTLTVADWDALYETMQINARVSTHKLLYGQQRFEQFEVQANGPLDGLSIQTKGQMNRQPVDIHTKLQYNHAQNRLELKLNSKATQLKSLGTDIHLQNLEFKRISGQHFKVRGYGNLGQGRFDIDGSIQSKNMFPTVHLSFWGQDLDISNTRDTKIKADAHLRFELLPNHSSLTGDVWIKQADIQIQQTKSVQAPSSDVLIVQSKETMTPATVGTPKLPLLESSDIQVQLHLGDDCRFRGYGVDSYFFGKLHLSRKDQKPLTATGKIEGRDGTYATRGRKLELTHAKLIYSHAPLTNPILDVRGQKKIELKTHKAQKPHDTLFDNNGISETHGVVGVHLQGTLKAPQLKLYSTPSMSESDILSYLVLDKPQALASSSEGQVLFAAAHELLYQFGPQTNDLRPSIQETFKLDKISLDVKPTEDGSSGLEQTAIVVGKQLSKRFYVEYAYGILDSASSIHVQYMIGNHLTLETTASKNSVSADLLFIFERG